MIEAARSRRDDARQEPQLAIPGRPAPADAPDPLAELARLVGQDDPFRGVFRPPAPAPDREPVHAAPVDAVREFREDYARPDHGHSGYTVADQDDGQPPHPDEHADPAHGDDGFDPYLAQGAHHAAMERAAYPDEAGLADERFAPDYASTDALPDHWAGGEEGAPFPVDVDPAPIRAGGGSPSARRPLLVLAAVLVLTGGGLAASFLAKGPSSSGAAPAVAGRGAPTIMAASGPTKVKVDDPAATAPEDQDAALLNKNAGVSSGPVKIVSSQEQPADLGQLPKADLAEGARPLPPAAPSPFPEPKKVKTFVIHPDGTMMSGEPAPGIGQLADAAAPSPSTPRTAARGVATPGSAAAPPASVVALAADPAPAAAPPIKPQRQAASPGARTASAKPNDGTSSPAPGGSFGLQLASSPVEADANAAFAKLKKRYPAQLGALTATVHRAETGDKPVYRVRVGGMSQDDAKALCAELQGAGGSCYVVHN